MPSDDTAAAENPETTATHQGGESRKKGADESPEMTATRKECLTIAKYIPRGLDAFCDLNEVFQVSLLVDRVAANPDNETLQAAAQKILGKIDERTCARYRRTFDYVTVLAPHLLTLIGNKAKGAELDSLIKEMQAEVTHIHAEDGSRLRKVVGRYAAPNPDKQVIQPPVSTETKAGRARMGFNHPQLGQMLCPVKYLEDYIKDPHAVQKCFEDPSNPMKVTATVWPAYLYPGETPGAEYDPNDISKGLFRGYLMDRTSKHILTSPSSALHERAKGARSGNAKIHKMKTIEPEHIAYTAMQAHFMISSAEKWSDQDSLFNYTEYYYRIIRLLRETRNRAWADSLIEKIFGNPKGLMSTNAAITADDGDDDLLEMERQFEERNLKAGEIKFPSRPGTPLALVDFDVPPANAPDSDANRSHDAPNEEDGAHHHVDHQDLHLSNANTENTTSNGSSESATIAQ
ncbi:hypothetical protein JVT61DRAFT_9755 [Boletus reticuloceps]|uniref:Uncharacterized protein n=1 Tax=Boletus reticuloceps TaxID=495285 RepID=A0A8I3A5J2_9AGAM|nr:hypothetical protein JVT61DRAFT_9755 [Boletus reticuloceps]